MFPFPVENINNFEIFIPCNKIYVIHKMMHRLTLVYDNDFFNVIYQYK